MAARPLPDLVHPSWAVALAPVAETLSELGAFLRAEIAAGRGYLPAGPLVLRAFAAPMDAVRVLIVGQDPYPTPGHPVGLSFSVAPDVRPIPRSLENIYRELQTDLGVPAPTSGDLTPWAERGVLLLNRVLTRPAGRLGLASRQGVGGGHRLRDRRARRARRAARSDPVGPGRAQPAPSARGDYGYRERAPIAAVGALRLLRLAALLARQCGTRRPGRRAGGLVPPVTALSRPGEPTAFPPDATTPSWAREDFLCEHELCGIGREC